MTASARQAQENEGWKYLNVETFVFESHDKSSGDVSCKRPLSSLQIVVQLHQPGANTITKGNNGF